MKAIQIATNPTPCDNSETHYVDVECHEKFTIVLDDNLKPVGTFLLPLEDIKSLEDDDLRKMTK